jgi:hypothetical protein
LSAYETVHVADCLTKVHAQWSGYMKTMTCRELGGVVIKVYSPKLGAKWSRQ